MDAAFPFRKMQPKIPHILEATSSRNSFLVLLSAAHEVMHEAMYESHAVSVVEGCQDIRFHWNKETDAMTHEHELASVLQALLGQVDCFLSDASIHERISFPIIRSMTHIGHSIGDLLQSSFRISHR